MSGFILEMKALWGNYLPFFFWFSDFNHIALTATLKCINDKNYGAKNKYPKLQVLGVRLPQEKHTI